MNDSPNSNTSAPVQPVLPMDVRRRVADLARVPDKEREEFYDVIQLPVRFVWEMHRRATGTEAEGALDRAAAAARALHEAFNGLNPVDREWVEELSRKSPQYERILPALPGTINTLAHLLSIAVGRAPPRDVGEVHRRGRRKGNVKDLALREFVHYLLVVTEEWCGGTFTFNKNIGTGTLLEAIKILRRYLPNDALPKPLPLMTIERVKTNRGDYIGYPDIDFYRAGPLDQKIANS